MQRLLMTKMIRFTLYGIEREQSLSIKQEITNDTEACLLTQALRGDFKKDDTHCDGLSSTGRVKPKGPELQSLDQLCSSAYRALPDNPWLPSSS